ncbi:hypothetical protein LKL35_19895 [Streptomyces sp. ET3-23]|uniref:VC0807 family protein n=1 Tax=Streptomyces sp. ET3-23 TaxID=2885643 RepID=UPI001D10FBA4|nr:VC0807 family protein [Streptomyces sp. ET3-23]MCC2277663.1 hypothetical protein [Streptomyces sp. ET3-23]
MFQTTTEPTTATETATPRPVPADEAAAQRRALVQSLKPLVVDAGIPMAAYYVLTRGCGMSTMAALAWSGVVPLVRTVWGIAKERKVNGLAAVMLVLNVAGVLLSMVAGDVRLMLAKDSAGTGVFGLVVLAAAFAGRPLMSAGLKPFATKGAPAKEAAWERLSEGSVRFRRLERRFSAIWGGALLIEAVARVVGAYTLSPDVMAWLGNVLFGVAFVAAMVVGGGAAADPMEKLVEQEAAA